MAELNIECTNFVMNVNENKHGWQIVRQILVRSL